jgi:hypothetical protein
MGCGDLPQCNRRYRIGAQIREPRRPLDSVPPSHSWRQTYKNAAPQRNRHRSFGPVQLQLPVLNQSRPVTSRYYNNCEITAQLRAQRSPAGKRLDSLPNLHESCRPVQISAVPHHFSPDFAPLLAAPGATQQRPDSTRRHHAQLAHHNAPANQRGSARPTTRSLPAEPSLLLSERPREICRTQYGPFRGHHPPAPAVPVSCSVLRSGGADRHKTHVETFPHW